MQRIDAQVVTDLLSSPEHYGQFALFLGAGCSVSAGIPAAAGVAADGARRLYLMHHETVDSEATIDAWLKCQGIDRAGDTAYSDILEAIRPTPRLRRSFLEPYFRGRNPSPAHWALAKLVQARILKDIYTTNFDDLLEQSVGQLTHLRVVSYDEQAADSGDLERGPTLYKLHGDYLFDRLANTEPELAHLGFSQAAKLQGACHRGGIVVIGYSGRDASIMDVFKASAQSGIPLGLYWLAKDPQALAPTAIELIESSDSCYLSLIDSFDSFVAKLADKITRSRTTINAEQDLADAGEPFVAHDDGVRALITKIISALGHADSSVVCISGLPGVGKTTTARKAAAEMSSNFAAYATISAKDRVMTASDIIDQCYLQMPVNIAVSSPGEADIGALMQYLASNRVLLLLDNLDGVDNTVLSFLQHLPGPSRALVTARDARDLRLQIPHVWEVEHIGLTRDEMAELLQLWVKRSPTLGRKIGNATPEEVERLLIVSNGWPEAMVMLLTTLSNSLLHINELDEKVQQNIYDFILRGLYGGLDRTARATLVWTGSFPVTFTLDGLIQVSGLSRRSMEQAVTRLIGSHLIKEVLAGQYTWSHPIVREYAYGKAQSHVSSTLRQDKVETFLQTWTSQHGGQPKSDWSNFACLDREFENLKVLMERTATRKAYDVVTRIYRSLFSYIVERGYWTFTEAWCERMVAQRLRRSDLPDWLIWWSWIKYYLRHDFSASASLAEEALTLNPRGNRQRFEAHRRALMAQGQLGRSEAVAKHLEAAQDICRRSWNADSDEAIDLLNSNATAWLGIASATQVESMYEEALVVYERAERIAIRREDPNIREIGIAMLGQARCLRALGQVELALERTQSSLDYASRVSWLRGIAETNELVADLASRLGQFSLAESASELAEQTSRRLRAPTTIGLGGRE